MCVTSRGQHGVRVCVCVLWRSEAEVMRRFLPYKKRPWVLHYAHICTSDLLFNTLTRWKHTCENRVGGTWVAVCVCSAFSVTLTLFWSGFNEETYFRERAGWCWPRSVNPVRFPCAVIQPQSLQNVDLIKIESPLISGSGLDHISSVNTHDMLILRVGMGELLLLITEAKFWFMGLHLAVTEKALDCKCYSCVSCLIIWGFKLISSFKRDSFLHHFPSWDFLSYFSYQPRDNGEIIVWFRFDKHLSYQ